MKIYHQNIEKATLDNENYRKVEYTHSGLMQMVLMKIKPGEEIGMEVHEEHDQFIRIEKGKGVAEIKEGGEIKQYELYDGIAIIIPSGTFHNIINTGKEDLKLYSIYTPPEHKDGLIQKEKPKQTGGNISEYKEKYLKYKNKYIMLKNKKI